MTPEQEAHRVRFEQRSAQHFELTSTEVLNEREGLRYLLGALDDSWQAYQWALADADRAQRADLPPLPDDFSESKDWKAGSYAERVQWLLDMVSAQRAVPGVQGGEANLKLLQQALHALENHSGNYKLTALEGRVQKAAIDALTEAIAAAAQPPQQTDVSETDCGNIVALMKECRDALAEELAGWDLDPPLHHVKQAHDKCVAWLRKNTAALQQSAQPVGYRTGPLLWKERQSEQVVKITRWAQPMYGFTYPLYASPQSVEAYQAEIAKLKTDMRGLLADRETHRKQLAEALAAQPVEVQLVGMPDKDARKIVADAEKWAHSKDEVGIEIVRATQHYHGIKPASEGGE